MPYTSKISLVSTDQLILRLIHPSVFQVIGLDTDPLDDPVVELDDEITSFTYEGEAGQILVRVDGIRVLIEAWHREEKILMCAVRDRQLDGTEVSSPLTFYPNADPACNRLPGPDFLACELSIYSWDPATYLQGLDVKGTLGHFIADPDYYVWKSFHPDVFFPLWEQAFHVGRGPWQSARPMRGVPLFFVDNAIKLLKELGYHRVDAVPSWFNVARFFKNWDFQFTYGEHELMYEGICAGLERFADLSRAQESWLVSLQNLPESYIPAELRLPARWPVTHTNTYWIRMHLDLNEYVRPDGDTVAVDPSERQLTADIRRLRQKDCKSAGASVKVVVQSRGHRPCTDTLGESSPGATSPRATSKKKRKQ